MAIDTEKLIPEEVKKALQEHGLHKVASVHFGVENITVKTASEIIGAKLLARSSERRSIYTGLAALAELGE